MQTLTIRASTQEVADGLFVALDAFHPEMSPSAHGSYDVTVALEQSPDQLISVLNALHDHVARGNNGPAVLELDGRKYALDA
jgi:hypothetical protein